MMKYLLHFLLLIFAAITNAQKITVEKVLLACKEKAQIHPNFPFNYRYGVELILKNTSDNNQLVATKINSATTMFNRDNIYQVSLSYQLVKHGEHVIVPPKNDLNLVELHPGEITSISYQFSHNTFIEQAKIEFIASDLLAGRFKNWQGRALSPTAKTRIMSQCKT